MLLFSHPTGNANVRHAALALHEAGLLGEFWTCINYQDTPLIRRLLPARVAGQLRRRSFPPELAGRIRATPLREMARLFAPRAGLRALVRHETGLLSVDAVYRDLDRRAARRLREGNFTGVYAYEDGAEALFRVAGDRGLTCCYDLPIGYWRAARSILQAEHEHAPEWAGTLTGNLDSARKTARKDAELSQADIVFVASSFTLQTLDEAPDFQGTVVVAPYGAPLDQPRPPRAAPRTDGPLRVLFVGSLGQRKGLSYLLDAVDRLGSGAELTLIGTRPSAPCAPLDQALRRHRWIPSCPHHRVLEEMAAHDVFVFPSLFEGFGLVLLEAMAMGLPVITTPHTAGPDLIDEGTEGFIVPIRSAGAIAEKLELLRADPALRRAMGEAARLRAERSTWENYRRNLAACVSSALVGH